MGADGEGLQRRRLPPAARAIAAGSMSGVAATVVCHPLDTIRTRLQTEDLLLQRRASSGLVKRRYHGALDCLQQTVRHEGVSALYKGLSGPLMAQAVYKAVMFGGFGFASRRLDLASYREAGAHEQILGRAFLCGGFAGTLNAFVVCPIELVRNRLMVQRNAAGTAGTGAREAYSGAWDCVRKTVATEAGGPAALWRGLSSTVLRDGPGVGMWFGSFEATKLLLSQGLGWSLTSNATLLASGAMGGVGFWLVALPFDTIKSNIQTARAAEDASISSVVRRLGLRGLYTGLGVSLVRGIPGAGITFFVQKRASDYFDRLAEAPGEA